MGKESTWFGVLISALLVVMALMGRRPDGGLPELADLEEPEATTSMCGVPLVGPVLCWVQHQFALTSYELDDIELP